MVHVTELVEVLNQQADNTHLDATLTVKVTARSARQMVSELADNQQRLDDYAAGVEHLAMCLGAGLPLDGLADVIEKLQKLRK